MQKDSNYMIGVVLFPILGWIISIFFWFFQDKKIYDAGQGDSFNCTIRNLIFENYIIEYSLENCAQIFSQKTNVDYFYWNNPILNGTLTCFGLENNCDNIFLLLQYGRVDFDSIIIIIIGTIYISILFLTGLFFWIYQRKNYKQINN